MPTSTLSRCLSSRKHNIILKINFNEILNISLLRITELQKNPNFHNNKRTSSLINFEYSNDLYKMFNHFYPNLLSRPGPSPSPSSSPCPNRPPSRIKVPQKRKQALRNSCEQLRQRKELHTSSWNCIQAHGTL